MTIPLDLEPIRERLAKATPGPWIEFWDDGKPDSIMPAMRPGDICSTVGSTKTDADFIANSITDVDALLAEVERLKTALRKHGYHDLDCICFGEGDHGDECSCGLSAALDRSAQNG